MGVECVLAAGLLRVKFVRRGDRIGHVIELAVGGKLTGLLESCEGTADERWPASPPVQELEAAGSQTPARQKPAAPQVAWLIGRAGASHWSASVEAQEDGAITFDVACRVRDAPTWLGSRYRMLEAAIARRVIVEPLEGCRCEPPGGDSRSDRGATAGLPSTVEIKNAPIGEQITIAADFRASRFPCTVRWRYRLAWRD